MTALPRYSPGEEIANSIAHAVGIVRRPLRRGRRDPMFTLPLVLGRLPAAAPQPLPKHAAAGFLPLGGARHCFAVPSQVVARSDGTDA